MDKNQKNFMIIATIVIIISFTISFTYHKYQDKELEKKTEIFKNMLLGKEVKEEKGWFVKLKESIFGTEEEKIEKELDKKVEKVIEIENKYSKEEDFDKKEKLSEEFRRLSKEVANLQDKYYSLTGVYYETKIEKKLKEENEREKIERAVETLSLEEKFKEDLRNSYISKNFSLKNTSFFQKTRTFLGANKIESFKNENQRVEITYKKNETKVEEFLDDKVIRVIEYKTEDNYNTVTAKIEYMEKGFTRMLENVKNGFGIDKFKDGTRIEFKHENQIPVGPAVRYFMNGDREEFIYRNGKKHGFSTYYFTNGDKEEVYYVEDTLEGKAKYTYADGYVEIYRYKNGQREE